MFRLDCLSRATKRPKGTNRRIFRVTRFNVLIIGKIVGEV